LTRLTLRKTMALLATVLGAGFTAVAGPGTAAATTDPTPNIVGGTLAAPGEFPWMVSLSVGCGGSLFTPTLVLTAAHCVTATGPNTSITITAGAVDLQDPSRITRTSNFVHKGPIAPITNANDWALIRMSAPINNLPLLPVATDASPHSGNFTVAGWGATSEAGAGERFLRKADVPFVDDIPCARAYPNLNFDAHLCAGNLAAGGVDTCFGDSGGPMFKRHPVTQQWVQVGITSFGRGCARPGFPGVYTEVRTYAAEICRVATSLGGCPTLTLTNPGTQAHLFNQPITPINPVATGGTAPLTWSATGLPPGLSIDQATGRITGTPTQRGVFNASIAVTDSAAGLARASLQWNVRDAFECWSRLTDHRQRPITDFTPLLRTAFNGCAGNASATSTVSVDITHTAIGNLTINLIAPDGTSYNLHPNLGGSTDNLVKTFTVDLSGEPKLGTWTLRINDVVTGDTGQLNESSFAF